MWCPRLSVDWWVHRSKPARTPSVRREHLQGCCSSERSVQLLPPPQKKNKKTLSTSRRNLGNFLIFQPTFSPIGMYIRTAVPGVQTSSWDDPPRTQDQDQLNFALNGLSTYFKHNIYIYICISITYACFSGYRITPRATSTTPTFSIRLSRLPGYHAQTDHASSRTATGTAAVVVESGYSCNIIHSNSTAHTHFRWSFPACLSLLYSL